MATVALFQPKNTRVELASPSVFVYRDAIITSDGSEPSWSSEQWPDESLVPQTLTLGANGTPHLLKVGVVVSDGNGRRAGERPYEFGDRIRVNVRWADGTEEELFSGYVGQNSLDYTSNVGREDFEGEGLAVYGPAILTSATDQIPFLRTEYEDSEIAKGAPVGGALHPFEQGNSANFRERIIFNPGISGNDSNGNATPLDDGEQSYFMATGRRQLDANGGVVYEAQVWTAYTAANWIHDQIRVETITQADEAIDDNLPAMKAELDAIPLPTVDITGLTSAQALGKVLNVVGYGFAFAPGVVSTIPGTVSRGLTIYKLSGNQPVDGPWMGDRKNAVSMSDVEGQRIQVAGLRYSRAANTSRNDWTIIGDYKRIETVLVWDGIQTSSVGTLRQAWLEFDATLGDWAIDGVLNEKSVTGSADDFQDSFGWQSPTLERHSFRSFGWNEDGGLSPTVPNIPDLTATYGDSTATKLIRRPRPMQRSIVYDDATMLRLKPVIVELGIWTNPAGTKVTDDDSWIKVGAYIWRDRMGFTLTVNDLLGGYPYASQKDKSLKDSYGGKSLAQLLYNTNHIAGNSSEPRAQLRISGSVETDDRVVGRAEKRQQTAWPFTHKAVEYQPQRFKRSILSDTSLSGAERDDRDACTAYAEARRDVSEDALGMGSIVLRGIDLTYRIGQSIDKTRGHEVDLTVSSGAGGVRRPMIVGITYDFREGNIQTELMLDTRIMGRVR